MPNPTLGSSRLVIRGETDYLQTEFLLAVMRDDAERAELLLSRLMMGERHELEIMLNRAAKLTNLYRQAHDNL